MASVYILDQRDETKIRQQINTINTNIIDINERIEADENDARASHNSLQTTITGVQVILQNSINDTKTELEHDIEDAKTELSASIGTNADAIASNLELIKKTKNDLTTKINTDKSELTTKINTEADTRKTNDDALDERLQDVEAFFATVETPDEVIDTLSEIQKYIQDDKTGAAAMTASINKNAGNIQTNANAIAAEKTRAEGVESGLNTRLTTAEGEIDDLQAQDTTLQTNIDTVSANLTNSINAISTDVTDDIAELRNSKVNISDIADNLETEDATEPLSANQGVVLKDSIASLSGVVDSNKQELLTSIGANTTSINNVAADLTAHNTDTNAHADIRSSVTDLSGKVDTLLGSDETTLTQMQEMVAYIQANQQLIENSTSGIIPIENGGTGATTASAALNNLGITWGTAEAPSTGEPNTIYIQIS